MHSTLSVFPAQKKILDGIKLPFVVYASPIPDELNVVMKQDHDIPRCPNPNCTAFYSGLCQSSSKGWTCAICGTRSSFKDGARIPRCVRSSPSFQIIDPSVTFPLTHVVVIGCGDISPARVIMRSLPPQAPVQVFVMSSPETARKLVTTAGNVAQLDKLTSPTECVSVSATIPLLLTLLNAKKSCFWCRLFCKGDTVDEKGFEKLKQFERIPIRIDCFVDSPLEPISKLRVKLPGVCRLFSSFSNPDVLETAVNVAVADCMRPFGFQCKVVLKCGQHFKVAPDEDRAIIPVVGSNRTHVAFLLTPPTNDPQLSFQAVQVVAHVHVWDPPTNMLRKCTNILNDDFPVSSELTEVARSASSAILFDFYLRHDNLPLIEKFHTNLPNLQPLFELYHSATTKKDTVFSQRGSFHSFCAEFLSICSPVTWRFVLGTFIEKWKSKDSDEIIVIILKSFPDMYFSVKEGVDILLGDAVRKYVDLCKPFTVNVQQIPFHRMNSLIESAPKPCSVTTLTV